MGTNELHPHFVVVKVQKESIPLFSKVWKVVKFYKVFCTKKTKDYKPKDIEGKGG
jgi:hypothetical protein